MIAYEFYRRDEKGENHFIWTLPERRKNQERITQESIMDWGRKAVVDNTELKDIFFIQVEIDEAQIESRGLIPLSELRERLRAYNAKEVMAQGIEGLTPASFEVVKEAFAEELAVEKREQNDLFRWRTLKLELICKNGSTVCAEVKMTFLRDLGGRPVGILGVTRDITEHKRVEEQLRNSHKQFRALSAHLQSVREEERAMIAREIHDELGQALTGLKMDLSWLSSKLPEDQKSLLGKTKSMLGLIDTTIQSVRKISTKLRPGVLDDLGLIAAIEWQVQEFQTRTGIRCKFIAPKEDLTLDKDRSTAVFRIFQETLTNVARHSNANRVKITLKKSNNYLALEVQDNGKGIEESKVCDSKSLGLLGMRERAYYFGGEVKFEGTQGKGTKVTVLIPLKGKIEGIEARDYD